MALEGVNQPNILPTTRTGTAAPDAAIQDNVGQGARIGAMAKVEGPPIPVSGPGIAADSTITSRKPSKTGLTKPLPVVDLNKLDWTRVPDPRLANSQSQVAAFSYVPHNLADMKGALDGDMAGADANHYIVDTYASFDKSFTSYLGNPPVANWTTFGKYAAREAGQDITRLEVELKALDLHHPDAHSIFKSIADIVKHPDLIGHAGKAIVEDAAQKAGFSFGDLAGLLLGPMALFSLPSKLPKILSFGHFLHADMTTLHKGLLEAHVGIYGNFAPAFDTFLKAESEHGDGVEAVRAAVAKGELNDPNGLLVDALSCYKQAHGLDAQAALAHDPQEKQQILERREALVKRGTLLIGIQEQYGVAQPLAFDDPQFHKLMEGISPYLAVRDASGAHALLQNGNWADFATRMGFVEMPASEGARLFKGNEDPNGEVFCLKDPQGNQHYFSPNPDAKARKGSVSDYFNNAASGDVAAKNINNAPPPLEVGRTTPTDATVVIKR